MPIDLATMPHASTEIADLVERLRTGRCVLCAGITPGAADGERSFRTLVDKLIAALPDGDADGAREVLESRPLAAAGFVRRRLGDRFADELKKAAAPFARAAPRRSRLLGELPFRAIVTTAYDDTFERAFTRTAWCRASTRRATPRRSRTTASCASSSRRSAIRRAPTRSCGRPRICRRALADGGYRTVAHDLYRSRSFLFVGFDGRDPDLAILLERVLAGARAGDVEHFAVLPGLGAVEKEELYAAYRIRVLVGRERDRAGARSSRTPSATSSAPALPDDDDFDGWLALLAEEPARRRRRARSSSTRSTKKLRERSDWEKLVELLLGPRRRRAGASSGAPQMLLEVARIFEHEVGDLSKAFTALLAGLQGGSARRGVDRARAAGVRRPACGASCSPSWPRWCRRCPTASARRRGCASRGCTATSSTRGVRAHLARRGAQARRRRSTDAPSCASRSAAARALDGAGRRRSGAPRRIRRQQAELCSSRRDLGESRWATAAGVALSRGARAGSDCARGARGAGERCCAAAASGAS